MEYSSTMKKILSGSLVIFSLVGAAHAFALTPAYLDVPAGVWYEEAVTSMQKKGFLDATSGLFRPTQNATRAEFIKLIVELNGGIINRASKEKSFDDISAGDWYYPYIDEAAQEKWIRGAGDCLGSHPCLVSPNASITRAEAAVLVARAFDLSSNGISGPFPDVPKDAWFSDAMIALAYNCFMVGDDDTHLMRPFSPMNRAEMVVLFHRVDDPPACEQPIQPHNQIRNVLWASFNTVEVAFDRAIGSDAIVDTSRYSLSYGSGVLKILSAARVDEKTVQLNTEDTAVECGEPYLLTVDSMPSLAGNVFSDSLEFKGMCN